MMVLTLARVQTLIQRHSPLSRRLCPLRVSHPAADPSPWRQSTPSTLSGITAHSRSTASEATRGPEGGGFEVQTGVCNYGAFVQPLSTPIKAVDAPISLRHETLDSAEPAIAHGALDGDRRERGGLSAPNSFEVSVPTKTPAPRLPGSPHNHGFNSWRFVAVDLASLVEALETGVDEAREEEGAEERAPASSSTLGVREGLDCRPLLCSLMPPRARPTPPSSIKSARPSQMRCLCQTR